MQDKKSHPQPTACLPPFPASLHWPILPQTLWPWYGAKKYTCEQDNLGQCPGEVDPVMGKRGLN